MIKGRAGGFNEGFAWARSDQPEVRWYDGLGGLVQIARWDEEPPPLSDAWKRSLATFYEDMIRERGGDDDALATQLRALEEGFERHGGPLPYWDAFFVDRRGDVWLGAYPVAVQAPGLWRIISRDGVFQAWVELPGVMAILDVTEDRILGWRQNEFDVPALVMFELIRR
jgi:hypothetical protein